jgi:hypothetical protein
MCNVAYTEKNHNGYEDPFLSPSLIPKEILKKFPPCYFNIGVLDPLFDDGIYMARFILTLIIGKEDK